MDAATELTKTVKELCAVLPALDAIQTPELVRPNVSHGQPVTQELAFWSLRVYAYSILSQFREMLRSTLMLQDAGQVPAVFLCCRALFEMAAHAYYVKKHAFQYLDKKDYQAVWDFMLGINQGSRYMREKQKAGAFPHKTHEIEEGPHIAKIIACFNEYFLERGKKEATENYSFLSEFCHPNSFAFTNHIEVEESQTGVAARVTFSRPSPEASIQVLPDALFSCMPLLFSMDEMLKRMNDTGFGKACQEFARITDPMSLLPEFVAKWSSLGLKVEGERIQGCYGFLMEYDGRLWMWTHSHSPDKHEFFPLLNGYDEMKAVWLLTGQTSTSC